MKHVCRFSAMTSPQHRTEIASLLRRKHLGAAGPPALARCSGRGRPHGRATPEVNCTLGVLPSGQATQERRASTDCVWPEGGGRPRVLTWICCWSKLILCCCCRSCCCCRAICGEIDTKGLEARRGSRGTLPMFCSSASDLTLMEVIKMGGGAPKSASKSPFWRVQHDL